MKANAYRKSYHKQPAGIKYLGWNFALDIGSNTTLSSVTADLVNLTDPTEDTDSMKSGSPVIGTATKVTNYGFDWVTEASGSWIAQLIQGGTDGDKYKLTLSAIDSTGQKHQGEVEIYLQDL